MTVARIETLEQNPIGRQLYPSLGFLEVARQIHFAMPLFPRPASIPRAAVTWRFLTRCDFSSAEPAIPGASDAIQCY